MTHILKQNRLHVSQDLYNRIVADLPAAKSLNDLKVKYGVGTTALGCINRGAHCLSNSKFQYPINPKLSHKRLTNLEYAAMRNNEAPVVKPVIEPIKSVNPFKSIESTIIILDINNESIKKFTKEKMVNYVDNDTLNNVKSFNDDLTKFVNDGVNHFNTQLSNLLKKEFKNFYFEKYLKLSSKDVKDFVNPQSTSETF